MSYSAMTRGGVGNCQSNFNTTEEMFDSDDDIPLECDSDERIVQIFFSRKKKKGDSDNVGKMPLSSSCLTRS